jgi:hypothetical protein
MLGSLVAGAAAGTLKDAKKHPVKSKVKPRSGPGADDTAL